MVSLGSCTLGALHAYSAGIKELAQLFPSKWGVLLTTDLHMRTERWSALREKYARAPPDGYDVKHPWSYIISASAWG